MSTGRPSPTSSGPGRALVAVYGLFALSATARAAVTPWGVPTRGYRTRQKGKASDSMIVRGRKRGKRR